MSLERIKSELLRVATGGIPQTVHSGTAGPIAQKSMGRRAKSRTREDARGKDMKPFDLEAALAGAPVITRDGRPVTQLHKFDATTPLCLVGVVGGEVYSWGKEGIFFAKSSGSFDLFMAPVKREGWINLYKIIVLPYEVRAGSVYRTKQEADEGATVDRIACVRVEWEE